MSYFSSEAEIERIGRGLIDCSLPKSEWTHVAHLAAALWLIRQSSLDAVRDMPRLIRAYNEATGVANTDTGGYHETITLASLRAANSWSLEHSRVSLHETVEGLLATKLARSDWLLAYWSRPVLFSVAARRGWVEPDLQPFPFA